MSLPWLTSATSFFDDVVRNRNMHMQAILMALPHFLSLSSLRGGECDCGEERGWV